MDTRNFVEAQQYTEKVAEILSRKRNVRAASVGSNIRNDFKTIGQPFSNSIQSEGSIASSRYKLHLEREKNEQQKMIGKLPRIIDDLYGGD